MRRNITSHGILSFPSLMISQSGNVTVQISRNIAAGIEGLSSSTAAAAGVAGRKKKDILYSFVLVVTVNEEY